MSSVYIVHCIDTEGPLFEGIDETFLRLNDVFNLNIKPSKKNLNLLQNCKMNLNGLEIPVSKFLNSHRLKTFGSWDQINEMLEEACSEEFRNKLLDSDNNGWVYNWFCLDHVGYDGDNPRKRDLGHHKVFDFYNTIYNNNKNDNIQWHYHPLTATGNAHLCGTAYLNSNNIWEILSRKIIDRLWFPSAFRPGFHTERPDSNWFLEQWIPFDYANQSVRDRDKGQVDLEHGRLGDWRNAPKDWIIYHPSHDNYQIVGNSRRWIARCLNLNSRIRELRSQDIEDAFIRASEGKKTLLSFTNHDWRDIRFEIDEVREKIYKVSKKYPTIKFYFSNSIEGIRNCLNLVPKKSNLSCIIEDNKNNKSKTLKVRSQYPLFGPQPYLAIKRKDGKYFWENFDFQGYNYWSFTFDFQHFPPEFIDKIGIASNSPEGVVEIQVYDMQNKTWKYNLIND